MFTYFTSSPTLWPNTGLSAKHTNPPGLKIKTNKKSQLTRTYGWSDLDVRLRVRFVHGRRLCDRWKW